MTQYLKWILSVFRPRQKNSSSTETIKFKEKLSSLEDRLEKVETTNADLVICVQQLASALMSVAHQVADSKGESVDDALDRLMNSDDPNGSGYLH